MTTTFTAHALLTLVLGLGATARAAEPNTLSDAEKQAGFTLLFNGVDFDGWQQAGNWKIEDGAIYRAQSGGSLTYQAQPVPDDFELVFEWKVGKGSNSGVYYRPGQYEYQILDNQAHNDGKNPRTSAASLYFCVAPSKDVTHPVGEWNVGRILCQGTVIQHWLNGKKVIDFDYADPQYAGEVELLRRRGAELSGRGAYLYFQDHGDPVWYRNIKLRALTAGEKLDRTPVTPATISAESLQHEQEILQRIEQRRSPVGKKAEAKRQRQ